MRLRNLLKVADSGCLMQKGLLRTGVPGADEVLGGGIPMNTCMLISGVPGTGKTIFGLHFIYEGAKNGESGLFVAFEFNEEEIVQYAENFSMEFSKYIKMGLISVVSFQITGDRAIMFGKIAELIRSKKVKRAVLDSLTMFEAMDAGENAFNFRRELSDFLMGIKRSGATVLATSERSAEGIDTVSYKPQDFLFEGLILLTKVRKGSTFERCITVLKMRGMRHQLGIYPFTIEDGGVHIFPKQIPFSLMERE